jgi:hypothetical protein
MGSKKAESNEITTGTDPSYSTTLLAIKKSPDESLPSVVARVDSLLQDLKAIRPEGYTIDNLDNNLSAMAMIHALGSEYAEFASSLVCCDPTRSEVVQAFICEHNNRLPHAGAADNAAYHAHASPLSSSTQDAMCDFCGFKGHLEATCHCRAAARDQACKDIADHKAGCRPGHSQATNAASAAAASSDSVQSAGQAYSIELAGNASTRGYCSYDASPSLVCLLQFLQYPNPPR